MRAGWRRYSGGLMGLVLVYLCMGGCATPGGTSAAKGNRDGNALWFVDASEGLPPKGQWRQGMDVRDPVHGGHLALVAPPARLCADADRHPWVWRRSDGGTWTMAGVSVPGDDRFDYGDCTVGDFNGDGIPDLGFAMHGLGLRAYFGDGKGGFLPGSKNLPQMKTFASRALVSGDLDGDGRADLAAVSEAKFGQEYPLPLGIMTCSFKDGVWIYRSPHETKGEGGFYADQIVAGDVNGDGILDLAVASLVHYKTAIVWVGDGKGGFSPFNTGLPTGLHYLSVGLADMDGDGRDDLVACVGDIGKGTRSALKLFLSRGEGFFDASAGLPAEVFYCVGTGDLDGDKIPEILVATADGGLRVFRSAGGAWTEIQQKGLPEKGLGRISRIFCVDVDGDGLRDIVVSGAGGSADPDAGGIRVLLNVTLKEKRS